jgi:hypothetical protein
MPKVLAAAFVVLTVLAAGVAIAGVYALTAVHVRRPQKAADV